MKKKKQEKKLLHIREKKQIIRERESERAIHVYVIRLLSVEYFAEFSIENMLECLKNGEKAIDLHLSKYNWIIYIQEVGKKGFKL